MKKIWVSLIAVFALGLSGANVQASPADGFSASELQKASAALNLQLPMTMDVDTRLDSTSAGPGLKLTYRYTLTSYAAADLDSGQLQQIMEGAIRQSACLDPNMRQFFTNGVTIGYDYRGNKGGKVMAFSISPSDCGM